MEVAGTATYGLLFSILQTGSANPGKLVFVFEDPYFLIYFHEA